MNPRLLLATALTSLLAVLLSAGTAGAAASAPVATTGSAGAIATDRVTLSGSVNPNGAPTSWHFDYGTTAAYGASTPSQTIGAGPGNHPVNATLSNLTPGTTYHYRLVATSSAGVGTGGDASVITKGAAPVVSTLAASSVGTSDVHLNGSVNPNGLATSWYFEYGTSTAYTAKTAVQSAGSGMGAKDVSVAVGNLSAGATYHFALVATNPAGTATGGDLSVTTIGPPAAATTAVQQLTPNSVTLTGTVTTNGQPTSYAFQYGSTTSYGAASPNQNLAAGASPVAVSASITGLTPGTTYHFRLNATSAAGSTASSDATVSTPASVVLNPAASHVVAGRYVQLSGTTWGNQPGVQVTILAQPFGESTPTPVATVLTGASGNWTYPARPSILTAYQASASGGTSGSLQVGVSPAVTLRVLSGHRLLTHVSAGSSLAGKLVQLQRLVSGHWRTVRQSRLDPSSNVVFSADKNLPVGRSTVRVAMSVNEAGPGYQAAFSRQLTYARSAARQR